MLRALTLSVVLLPLVAQAGDPRFVQAQAKARSGDFDEAAPLYYAVAQQPGVSQSLAQLELARAYQKLKLPVIALITYAQILNAGPQHSGFVEATEALVQLQTQLDEQNLVPNVLSQAATPEARERWRKLSPEPLARVQFLVALIHQRRGQLQEARSLLGQIPFNTAVYAQARYLLGVVLADPRFPGRPQEAQKLDALAMTVFNEVLGLNAETEAAKRAQQLAALALGRVHYGRGEFAQASSAYERVPRYTAFWDQALFENGFARFRQDDLGGALGSLQSLHAPQFAQAFQPESWILKATVYYYSCLFDEARAALAAFDAVFEPLAKQLAPYAAEDADPIGAFNLVSVDKSKLPRPVYLWVRNNERIRGVLALLAQIDTEKKEISARGAWKGQPFAAESVSVLEENRNTLLQIGGALAKARLQEAQANLRTFADQAEVIRVQTALDEKDLYMAGVDQEKLLASQTLFRPAMPGEDWNYWKFQGEFWIDEMGYYQYTLKRGCPAQRRD